MTPDGDRYLEEADKTDGYASPQMVADVLDSWEMDVTPINPRLGEMLDLASYWLSLTDVKEAIAVHAKQLGEM